MPAESDAARPLFLPYCKGLGLNIGFGGARLSDLDTEITFDMPTPYSPSFYGDKQIMRGDCRHLGMFCDESLSFIISSHVVEDWTYSDLLPIIREWRRVLKPGGWLLTTAPNQKDYLAYNDKQGTQAFVNLAHKEATFSLETWNVNVIAKTGPWVIAAEEILPPYSWAQCAQRPL